MLRFDRRSGNLAVTDLGRAASHFYISHESVFRFNGAMMPTLSDAAALNTVCLASEFDQVKVRGLLLLCAICGRDSTFCLPRLIFMTHGSSPTEELPNEACQVPDMCCIPFVSHIFFHYDLGHG